MEDVKKNDASQKNDQETQNGQHIREQKEDKKEIKN